jgi:hypothetical protein
VVLAYGIGALRWLNRDGNRQNGYGSVRGCSVEAYWQRRRGETAAIEGQRRRRCCLRAAALRKRAGSEAASLGRQRRASRGAQGQGAQAARLRPLWGRGRRSPGRSRPGHWTGGASSAMARLADGPWPAWRVGQRGRGRSGCGLVEPTGSARRDRISFLRIYF